MSRGPSQSRQPCPKPGSVPFGPFRPHSACFLVAVSASLVCGCATMEEPCPTHYPESSQSTLLDQKQDKPSLWDQWWMPHLEPGWYGTWSVGK